MLLDRRRRRRSARCSRSSSSTRRRRACASISRSSRRCSSRRSPTACYVMFEARPVYNVVRRRPLRRSCRRTSVDAGDLAAGAARIRDAAADRAARRRRAPAGQIRSATNGTSSLSTAMTGGTDLANLPEVYVPYAGRRGRRRARRRSRSPTLAKRQAGVDAATVAGVRRGIAAAPRTRLRLPAVMKARNDDMTVVVDTHDRRHRRHPARLSVVIAHASRRVADDAIIGVLVRAVRDVSVPLHRRRGVRASPRAASRCAPRRRPPPPLPRAGDRRARATCCSTSRAAQAIVARERRRAARSRVAHQADDGVPRRSRALRDKTITPSQMVPVSTARVARRGLADVHRAAQARCRSTSCCAA